MQWISGRPNDLCCRLVVRAPSLRPFYGVTAAAASIAQGMACSPAITEPILRRAGVFLGYKSPNHSLNLWANHSFFDHLLGREGRRKLTELTWRPNDVAVTSRSVGRSKWS